MRHALLILILAALAAPAVGQTCEKNVDEFTGDTTIRCENEAITVTEQPGERISRAYVSAIYTPESKDAVYVSIVAVAESWNFLSTDTAYFLADGTRIEAESARGETETQSGSVIEQQIITLGQPEAQAIRRASTVRLKLSRAVFEAGALSRQLQALDQFRK